VVLRIKWYVVSASGRMKIGRDAVGARLEPKGGLQTYFEPLRTRLKDSNYLSSKNRR